MVVSREGGGGLRETSMGRLTSPFCSQKCPIDVYQTFDIGPFYGFLPPS